MPLRSYGIQRLSRKLHVSNLDPSVNDDFILALFSLIKPVRSCKRIPMSSYNIAYELEFERHSEASAVLLAMDKRSCLGRELKVRWAISSKDPIKSKRNAKRFFPLFVGNLDEEINGTQLFSAFQKFGDILNCRLIMDVNTGRSKGYGFVTFLHKEDAENALCLMNGTWLGTRRLKINWASQKPVLLGQEYDEILNQTSEGNSTVYCGGINDGLTEDLIYRTFRTFGNVINVRIFATRGYAFITFATQEAAAQAIMALNNTDINNQRVKCTWRQMPSNPQSSLYELQHYVGLQEAAMPNNSSPEEIQHIETTENTMDRNKIIAKAKEKFASHFVDRIVEEDENFNTFEELDEKIKKKLEQLEKEATPQTENENTLPLDCACLICEIMRKDIVFMPCKHLTLCNRCSAKLNSCPMCRTPVEKSLKVYLN